MRWYYRAEQDVSNRSKVRCTDDENEQLGKKKSFNQSSGMRDLLMRVPIMWMRLSL